MRPLVYGSVCSGIEAASLAWEPLGWRPAFFSQFDPSHDYAKGPDFASAVLAHRWPHVPNLGDFTKIDGAAWDIDVLVGGTPCQAFSAAGLRRSLDDERGRLTLSFVRLAHAIRSLRWLVWENVPDVLSTDDNAFGCFVGGLVGHDDALPAPRGGRWPHVGMVAGPLARAAWRVLDAQHFRLPQRRRRLFVVAIFGAAAGDPAEILFERKGLPGDFATGLEGWREAAGDVGLGAERDDRALDLNGYAECVAFALRGREHGAMAEIEGDRVGTLRAAGGGSSRSYLAFTAKDHGQDCGPISPTLRSGGFSKSHANGGVMPAVVVETGVRRFTPLECERLMGLPDHHTRIPWNGKPAELCPDGPRYFVIGNSMAVPVMRWIGARIELQEQRRRELKAA